MNKILKYYLIGAVIIYPVLFLSALANMWGSSDLQYDLMVIYAIFFIPVFAIQVFSKPKQPSVGTVNGSSWSKTISAILMILFVFVVIYLLLFFVK